MTQPDSSRIERFRLLVERHLGLYFEPSRAPWLADVLRQRSAGEGLSIDRYLARLQGAATAQEVTALAQLLTVPETYFFRHMDQLQVMRDVVVPERLRARGAQRVLRILSAGCASGEEAYTIAMCLRDVPALVGWQLAIQGVDINPAVIAKARQGRYADWALRETPPAQQMRWFRREGRDRVLDESIRGAVRFAQHNLCEDHPALWQPGSWDIVFCRNMLMYLTPPNARGLLGRIEQSLVPGGALFLGHAETLRGLSHGFQLRQAQGSFHYQRVEQAAAQDLAASRQPAGSGLWQSETADRWASGSAAGSAGGPARPGLPPDGDWVGSIGEAADRVRRLSDLPIGSGDAPMAATPPARRDGRALELLAQERFAEALALVQELLQGQPPTAARQAPPDADLMLLQAMLEVHCGQFLEAEAHCRALLALDDLNAGAHYALGLCREAASDARGASGQHQRAAQLDPDFAMPRLHLGLLARRAGERETAAQELGQAVLLLQHEQAARLRLFGGGFTREALLALCRAELTAVGAAAWR